MQNPVQTQTHINVDRLAARSFWFPVLRKSIQCRASRLSQALPGTILRRIHERRQWSLNGAAHAGTSLIGRPSLIAAVVLPLAWFAGGFAPLQAKLPSLNQAPWFGFFAGHTGSQGKFGIAEDGTLYYNHNSEAVGVSGGHFHRINPAVAETMPNGNVVIRRIIPETLQTQHEPSTKPDTVTFRSEVRGGATIEVIIEFSRRDVSIGGRIVDPGPGKNPLQFCFHTQAPPYYRLYNERKTLADGTPEEKEKLKQQIVRQTAVAAKEVLVLRGMDGKRVKLPLLDKVDLSCPDFNGKGFNSIDVDLNWLRGRKIAITATEDSRMKLSNTEPQPIFKENFHIIWTEDPAKQSAGKGRMVFTTR